MPWLGGAKCFGVEVLDVAWRWDTAMQAALEMGMGKGMGMRDRVLVLRIAARNKGRSEE